MILQSSRHFLVFFKNRRRRIILPRHVAHSLSVWGGLPGIFHAGHVALSEIIRGSLPGIVTQLSTRDTWRIRRVLGNNMRGSRGALRGFRGNNTSGTRGALGKGCEGGSEGFS